MSNKKREKPYFKNDDGVYECITCGEIREKQSTMCEHTKKHLGSFPFECNICKKGFLQKSCLEVHKKGKHKDKIKNDIEKFKCVFDNCDFESFAKGSLHVVADAPKKVGPTVEPKSSFGSIRVMEPMWLRSSLLIIGVSYDFSHFASAIGA